MQNISVTVQPPSEKDLRVGREQKQVADLIVVNSPSSHRFACNSLEFAKVMQKELTAKRKKITTPMEEAKKQVMDLFREPLEFLKETIAVLNKKIVSYESKLRHEQERERAEAEEQLRKEREALEREATQAQAEGHIEKAEAILSEADRLMMPVVHAPDPPKVPGLGTRKTWKAEITDIRALLQAVLDEQAPANLVQVNMVALNALARALKDQMKVPGVKVFEVETKVRTRN